MDHTSVQPAAHRSGLLLEDPDSASGKGKGLLIGVREYRQWSLGPPFFSGTSKKKVVLGTPYLSLLNPVYAAHVYSYVNCLF